MELGNRNGIIFIKSKSIMLTMPKRRVSPGRKKAGQQKKPKSITGEVELKQKGAKELAETFNEKPEMFEKMLWKEFVFDCFLRKGGKNLDKFVSTLSPENFLKLVGKLSQSVARRTSPRASEEGRWVYYLAKGMDPNKVRAFTKVLLKGGFGSASAFLYSIAEFGFLPKFVNGLGKNILIFQREISKEPAKAQAIGLKLLRCGAAPKTVEKLVGVDAREKMPMAARSKAIRGILIGPRAELFRGFKEKIVRGKKGLYVVTVGADNYESSRSFGICAVKPQFFGTGQIVSFSNAWLNSKPYKQLGRIKVVCSLEGGKKYVFIEAIQGAKRGKNKTTAGKHPKALLDDFSKSVGKPWALYLVEELTELAKKNGFSGIGIVMPKTQQYLKMRDYRHREALRNSAPLYSITAKRLGFNKRVERKGEKFYFKEL